MPSRIGVIELDEIERIGRIAALGAAGCGVVDAAAPVEAGEWNEESWRRFDVLLFGIVADDESWDRFDCIRIANRAHLANPNVRLVALCGDRVRPLVRVRLAQSGMHRIWSARRTRTIDELTRLINPAPHEGDRLAARGFDVRGAVVGTRTDPAAVLDHILEVEMTEVFDAADRQADTGLSRRQIMRLRREISQLGDLSVPSGYATGGPAVDRSLPSWRAVVNYVNRARGYGESTADEADNERLVSISA